MRPALALLCLLVWPAAAAAQCTVSATGVNFGAYDVFSSTARDSTGSITYRCLLPLAVQITLSTGSAGSFSPRTLRKGAEPLNYNLYRDSGRSTVWGDGSSGTSIYSATVTALQVAVDILVTVFGRIPAGQDVSAGSYTDTITVTINF
jgi:spore coat protein U-like protein